MTALEFRDPLHIILAQGCTNQHTERVWGADITICTAKDGKGKRRNHGRRCKAYSTEGNQ